MLSNIRDDIPIEGNNLTEDIRNNFTTIKEEVELISDGIVKFIDIKLTLLIVALPVAVQLLASVTVTVYEPAGKPVGSSTVLTIVDPVTQEYVYGAVPPETVILIDPIS
jgi:hypothetical protein